MSKKAFRTCPSCGAPMRSEVCQYCGQVNTAETKDLAAEYPTLECNNASLTFFGTVFPLAFAIGFGGCGCVMPVGFFIAGEMEPFIFLCFIPFAAVGIGAACITIRSLYRYFSVVINGKVFTNTHGQARGIG